MIKALAAKGGVIQINYEKSFIDQGYKDAADKTGGVVEMMDRLKKQCGDDDACIEKKMVEQEKQDTADGKLPHVSWQKSSTTSTMP